MANVKNGIAKTNNASVAKVTKNATAIAINALLDSEGIKNRINELLGRRAPQFVSSLVSLINADDKMLKVFHEAPITIIQSALRAASYDLPIDPGLGYAYLVPFKNNKKGGIMEAVFIMGYKGMYQLAMRTGVYKKLNVVDIREGELKRFDRLTEDIDIQFVEDEDTRAKLPVIGYCGYFRLVNGMEKIIYMTVAQLRAHEIKFRKGEYMGKGWKEDAESMMAKTVLRKLIGKWGIMSIDYQTASPDMVKAAEAIASGKLDDEDENTIDIKADEEKAPADMPQDEQSENDMSEEDYKKALAGMDVPEPEKAN